MDDPVKEITGIVRILCTASPSEQRKAIEKYFSSTASFTHPFCRTPSFNGSRWFIIQIYRWYKILSPRIDVAIDSVAFDEDHMLLYVSIRQDFKIPIVPFYNARPALVTVLKLTSDPYPHLREMTQMPAPEQRLEGKNEAPPSTSNSSALAAKSQTRNGQRSKSKYYIQSQNDLYQTSEFIKFIVPWGIGVMIIIIWQLWATLFCVSGAVLGWPITWLQENAIGGNMERLDNADFMGKD